MERQVTAITEQDLIEISPILLEAHRTDLLFSRALGADARITRPPLLFFRIRRSLLAWV